ncbi:MAG: asparagine synthase (glutamine-hydrolyzing) [Acidobacteria bacterium ACB1]|nr:Asparagine synthetase [glutamine-hydrolyzing] 1 [Pyrinomonadaceae bacterium]MCE7962361.1 asparagine synthase (glutamine-hydrolyzing) [Acidobacteria bacterium ACB1]RIJ96277.1 MAG: asparagine synthase (glutamine-hydrolyzing) [Acidobacteriota bacterium]
MRTGVSALHPMCGIAGWINLKQSDLSEDVEGVLHSMCERIVHRGPDSEGLWWDETVALGMRRLSVIDLKTGDQPVFSEDGTVVVMMNGELYNYREVRAELEKDRIMFVTRTDTEILPHLYTKYGDAFIDHVNGMYAFSLWDLRRRRLILARDRFGEKPLYYGVFDNKLIWASELKALIAHPSVNAELDLNAVRHYLSFDYVPAPLSIYKGIYKLPAAHMLTVENGEIKTRRYWDLERISSTRTNGANSSQTAIALGDRAEELRELLSDSVRMRLVSDVPLGILLSGGIDSSTIAAFAVRHATERVKTFSIGFEEDSFDESKYARLVAKHLDTEHYEEKLSATTAGDLIEDIGEWLDEPLSDGSLIPTYLLARFVRKYVTVALGGDGGDELFAGYPMYRAHKIAAMYRFVPSFVRNGLVRPAVEKLPVSHKNMSFDYKAKRFVRAAELDPVERHHSWFGSFAQDEQENLLTRDVLDITNADIYASAREVYENSPVKGKIAGMQYLDVNFYLAEDILTKVDRSAMQVSLETRAPFLDPRIADLAFSLPMKYKLRGSNGKVILKKAVEPMLPKTILERSKKGFGIPIAAWLRGRLRYLLHDLLSPEKLKEQGIFEPSYVDRLISEHEQGIASHHKELWTLLVFQLWNRKFLK